MKVHITDYRLFLPYRFFHVFSLLLSLFLLCPAQTVLASRPGHGAGRSGTGHDPFHAKPFSWHLSQRTGLPVLADGSMALPSNANHFHGRWNASVNSRTGRVSLSLVLASYLYDAGQIKRDLLLAWSGSPVPGGRDVFGLGPPWRWNVATEQPSESEVAGHLVTDIVTSNGHRLTMIKNRKASGKTVWEPLHHKLHDIIITGEPGNWTVTLANGIREHISRGYEDWEESRDGHRLWFHYDRNGSDYLRHLTGISSCLSAKRPFHCEQPGIDLRYHNHRIVIHGRQRVSVEFHGHRISSIILPSLSSPGTGMPMKPVRIHFIWDDAGNLPWLLHEMDYPDGSATTFLYNQESSGAYSTSGLDTGWSGVHLPVVTTQVKHSGRAGIPDQVVHYSYGNPDKNSHNYTGYQSSAILIPGHDNLMDREDDYTYETMMDNGLTRTFTRYNKYHLPLSVVLEENRHHQVVARTDYQYLPWKHTTFAQLPPTWSQPVASIRQFFSPSEQPGGRAERKSAIFNEEYRHDDSGRLIWKRDASGRELSVYYCPPAGDIHCPPMGGHRPPENMPEKILVIPSPLPGVQSQPLEVILDYTALPTARQLQKGHDLNSYGSFWKVKCKTVITLPSGSVTRRPQGGDLPEASAGTLQSRIDYHYDTRPESVTLGQMVRMKVTVSTMGRYDAGNSTLSGKKTWRTAIPFSSVTLGVQRTISTRSGTMITRTAVLSKNPESLHHQKTNASLFLGTEVYSLHTGLRQNAEDAMKTVRIRWIYDGWNRPVKKIITPVTGEPSQVTRWHYLFSQKEQAVVTTTPDGNQGKRVLGPDGQTLSTWHRFRSQATRPMAGNRYWIPDTAIDYTRTGKPATLTRWMAADPVDGKPGKAIRLVTRYGYDALNRPVWIKQPNGLITITARDDIALRQMEYTIATGSADQPVFKLLPLLKVTESSLSGQPVAIYTLSLNPEEKKQDHLLYDSALQQRLKSLAENMAEPSTLQTLDSDDLLPLAGRNGLLSFIRDVMDHKAWLSRTLITRDGLGHKVREERGNGMVTRWLWQGNTLKAKILPDGRTIRDSYDIHGHKTGRCVQAAGSHICHVLGSRGYDEMGNLVWQADAYHHITRYQSDTNGRKTTMITPATAQAPKGHTFHWRYNHLGVVSASVDGLPITRVLYDAVTGRITDRFDSISHLHYDYDPNTGFPVRVTHSAPNYRSPSGIIYPAGSRTMEYNRYGTPVRFTDSHGIRYTRQHDALGRLTGTRVWLPGESNPVTLVRITYNLRGQVATITNGAGITRTFEYDTGGQVIATTDRGRGRILLVLRYARDWETGNIIAFTREQAGSSATQYYRYDHSGNLTGMRCVSDGTVSLCPRETDIAGSGLTDPPQIVSRKYIFDRWNTMDSLEEQVDDHGKVVTKKIMFFHAGDLSQVKGKKDFDPYRMESFTVQWSTRTQSAIPRTLEYDAMGRVIRDGDGNTLHYNARGQMDAFVRKGTNETIHYYYDSAGYQVATRLFHGNGQPASFPLYLLYSGNRISSQVWTDDHGYRHVYAELDQVARYEDGKIVRWALHNYKGDVMSTLSRKGKQRRDTLYSPYGMAYELPDGNLPMFPWQSGFDGMMTDPATGYQFAGGGYRAYNPGIPGFMMPDSLSPFTEPDGYGFGHNNPIMYTDPSGHFPQWASYLEGLATIGAAVGLGLLLPVSTIYMTEFVGIWMINGVATNFVMTGLSMVSGTLGVASGSLQIARAAYDNTKKTNPFFYSRLYRSSEIVDLVHDIVSLANATVLTILGGAPFFVDELASLKEEGMSLFRPGYYSQAAMALSGASAGYSKTLSIIENSMQINSRHGNVGLSKSDLDKLNYVALASDFFALSFSLGMGLISGIKNIPFLFGRARICISCFRQNIMNVTGRRGYTSLGTRHNIEVELEAYGSTQREQSPWASLLKFGSVPTTRYGIGNLGPIVARTKFSQVSGYEQDSEKSVSPVSSIKTGREFDAVQQEYFTFQIPQM